MVEYDRKKELLLRSFQTQSFSSGSTIFGDTLTDTHQFGGSVDVSGSLTLNGQDLEQVSQHSIPTSERPSLRRIWYYLEFNCEFGALNAYYKILTSTNEDDFVFSKWSVHGTDGAQIQQTFLLKVDTDSIGYFESDDEIIAQGKFNA